MEELTKQEAASVAAIPLGIDIGSTTTKAVALDPHTLEPVFSSYRRHHAHQLESVRNLIEEVADSVDAPRFNVAISGSGALGIAEKLGVPYVQEVVANAIALRKLHSTARCAIELGGQDAKMIFFTPDPATGELSVSDMRMNGSCAGGTGAFLDEIASLLETPIEELDALAAQGETLYSISGRCGVYAKTDIQPLLNQGAPKPDIALSTFHAVAKQTIGGLAQGLDINPPVVFEGGPLTFNRTLIRVFAERLDLAPEDVIIPEHAETVVATGTALHAKSLAAEGKDVTLALEELGDRVSKVIDEGFTESVNPPLFASEDELAAFRAKHRVADPLPGPAAYEPGSVARVYLGIDSGSTTTKFVLLNEDGKPVDGFYSSNEGDPLGVAQAALGDMVDTWREAGVTLEVIGCATTGYGEELFAKAFHADTHMVETVAHSYAACKLDPEVSFVLDIGGQDMKAIWVADGVVTDILVNEACSSGCGSFLEGFADSLGIPVQRIADAAFSSTNPAALGSRCTVFMNSSVVTEQRNGKTPADIMAGLCRSIIENVFTKVIRVSNLDSLGPRIVVQGGTFANDAVLAAFEQYVERPVVRAPYPGLMGAIGAGLLAKRFVSAKLRDEGSYATTFIGFDRVRTLTHEHTSGLTCPFCTNACSRTLVTFDDGSTFVTGNRCEKGMVVGDPKDPAVRAELARVQQDANKAANVFELREKLLFADYAGEPLCAKRDVTIGLPRVLAFWDNMPFWSTFWRSLGFDVKMSRSSSRALYENGLSAVASDTVCFPAKLVHGHIRDLVNRKVDRIFMPIITTVSSENTEKTSESMCAVVKGYPFVIQNSDNPADKFDVPFDNPLFHWYTDADRERQLCKYLEEAYGIGADLTRKAIALADAAQQSFRTQLLDAGAAAIDEAEAKGRYAVILGSRPYHNDSLVNHDLPRMFTQLGVAVLPPDAVPGATEVDLSKSRIDIVNNFHARMLSCAIIAAQSPHLEFAQLVSFGCGHDAYLSDEIVRLMRTAGGKTPLILKVDESDISGPLRIRVRSFIETLEMREALAGEKADPCEVCKSLELPDPYPMKFEKSDRKIRTVLVPNTSHAFSRLMAAVLSLQGLKAVPMDIGREEAIRLGKKYVHNDICFPAQIVIGEALAELETGKYKHGEVAVATGKYVGDCRLTHYAALLRKALDDAGYEDVPIITNDDIDYHNMQPGFKMNLVSGIRIAMCLPMIDAMEAMLRRIRPYEFVKGAADAAFEKAMDVFFAGVERSGVRGAAAGFKKALQILSDVAFDKKTRKPRVLIVGEYLLNFHPGANHEVERYLEDNGFEIIEAHMTDVIRKTYFYKHAQFKEYDIKKPLGETLNISISDRVFDYAHDLADRIGRAFPLYEPAARMNEIVDASDPIIHHTFDAGEGVLIPAEILHHAKEGCRAFLILQPFGCLPNHIVGRGISKKLKEMYPQASILPLDYDPDVSFANIENRLQMLVMSAKASDK